MANYATLTAWIEAYIKTNGQQEITAQVLQTTLKKMVATLGDGYRLAGVATPDGTPTATDNDTLYLAAEAGTYTNYGGAVLDGSTLHLLTYSSEWGDIDTGVATATALAAVAQALGADIDAVAEVKADKASSNPAMLVGSAMGIMGNTPQAALFTHRAVPAGAGSGAAQMRMLRGKSLVWNQLVGADTESVTIPSGHKYYAVIDGVASVGTSDGTAIAVTGGTDMVVDLTQLTMPDLTAAQFEALYPGYHGHNAGTIKNLMATGVHSGSFNLWNEEWEAGNYSTANGTKANTAGYIRCKDAIPVRPNTLYYGKCTTTIVYLFYDANGGYLGASFDSSNICTTPSNCYYLRFYPYSVYGTTYNHDICINQSGAENGTYKPYTPIDYTLVLNIPTLKGKAGGVGDSVTIYPNGMMSAGAAYDYGRVDADGWMRKVVAAVGKRAYQEGDESDATLLTDGTNTNYPLATAVEYTLDTPIYMGYPVDADGTETMLPDQTALSEPSSAPLDYDVVYPVKVATAADLAAAIAAEAEALNAFIEANELGGSFAVTDGVLTYTPGE